MPEAVNQFVIHKQIYHEAVKDFYSLFGTEESWKNFEECLSTFSKEERQFLEPIDQFDKHLFRDLPLTFAIATVKSRLKILKGYLQDPKSELSGMNQRSILNYFSNGREIFPDSYSVRARSRSERGCLLGTSNLD